MYCKFWFSGMVFAGLVLALTASCNEEASEEPGGTSIMTKRVELQTTMGEIVIELEEEAAPITVENFIRYVGEGFYDGIIFHRVVKGFVIQGGGFAVDMNKKPTHPAVVNEFKLSNVRGTVAMAKLGGDPDSATSQFFINLVDNTRLDSTNGGFTVFGRVIEGMDVVDSIGAVKTATRMGTMEGRRVPMSNVPDVPVVIKTAKVISGK